MTPSAALATLCVGVALCAATVSGMESIGISEPPRNPIYAASDYQKVVARVKNGVLLSVDAPEEVHLQVLHLYGNASERGFAQGQLLSQRVVDFVNNDLDAYYKSEVDQIPLQFLPTWLANAIKGLLKSAAPEAFSLALGWVYGQQKDFIAASKAHIWEEADGIARGVCSIGNVTGDLCANDAKKLKNTIYHVNLLPELVQMQCSMMGAWGAATPTGKLVQLRTLDFGGGPFANQNLLVVQHPSDSAAAFATLSFPAFVGAVTGFSEHIGLSEKVDDVTGASRPKGSYKGQAVSMVIRDMIQFAETKEEAVAIAQAANRTWSVWLGVGDYSSQEFLAMNYQQASASPYDDQTLPALTNQTMYTSVAYIDKHPQPSPHPDMPNLIQEYYGNLSARNVVQNFPRVMQSGDVHIAAYDYGAKTAYIATGTTDGPAGNYTRLACDAPFLEFDMTQLWSYPAPKHA